MRLLLLLVVLAGVGASGCNSNKTTAPAGQAQVVFKEWGPTSADGSVYGHVSNLGTATAKAVIVTDEFGRHGTVRSDIPAGEESTFFTKMRSDGNYPAILGIEWQ